MTLSQIAEKSGVPLGTLNKLFAGQTTDPKLETIRAVVYALGGTLDSIDEAKQPKPLPLSYSAAALDLALQYDRLDSWGQAAVSAIVREEAARCEAPAAELAEIIELPHSLNPRYPDIVPADGETILCKGLVLGKLAAAWIVSK